MKTILAWYLVNFTYMTRPLYLALARMFESRAFYGTNPLKMLIDTLALLLIGPLLIGMVILSVVSLPFRWIYLVCFDRKEWLQMKGLVRDGRVKWGTGTFTDPVQPQEPEHGQE